MPSRSRAAALLLVVAFALAGCGTVDDAKEEAKKQVAAAKQEVKQEVKKVRKRLEKLRDRVEKRVDAALAELQRAVPQATSRTEVPTRRENTSFEEYMDGVLTNVDRYWTKTFTANDLEPPKVSRVFIREGEETGTGCGDSANDTAAFYCPADDTIYFGEALGKQVYDNIGDFGVAYALAHEYAHNVQQELGWFSEGTRVTTVAPFELQADCMAGAWGYAVYQEGRISDTDVSEAVKTAYAVGDFDLTNPQHHGTPEERSDAWLTGYRSGDPSTCRSFV